MKLIGKRRLDELGRVVLPSGLRSQIYWDANSELEIYLDGKTVVLKKSEASCIFCKSVTELFEFQGQYVCGGCRDQLSAQ